MTPDRDTTIKRLRMRSMRRGIKEMDLILSDFAARELDALGDDDLVLYERLLQENDHDIYGWILGQTAAPAPYEALMGRITLGAAGVVAAHGLHAKT